MIEACVLAAVLSAFCPAESRFAGDTAPATIAARSTIAAPAATLIAAPAAQDAWLAEDKLRHFGMSFAVTAMGYAAARFALDADEARLAAGAAAGAAGIGKELADHRRGERFSVRDLVWDAAGVALGLVLVRSIP